MTRRALVIASATGGLTGPNSDAARMSDLLKHRGFAVDLRIDNNATRAGILDGYSKLIADTTTGDASVVYYSGHGNLTINSAPDSAVKLFQNIVPFDYADSTDDDYRGISAWELSIKLRQLVQASPNATVILDCCHSAEMSRDGAVRDALARALPHPMRVSLDAHLAALRTLYPGIDPGPLGNTEAIRLVACAQDQVAFEYTNAKGVRTGAFTEAIVDLFGDIGDAPLTWGLIARAVRERVLRRFPTQRPDFAGSAARVVFALTEQRDDETVSLTRSGTIYRIGAGQIQSVSVGDIYDVAPAANPKQVVTKATVTQVAPTISTVSLAAAVDIPADAVAIPATRAAPVQAVTVIAPTAQLGPIEKALGTARTLRVAAADEADRSLAILRAADNRFVIEDARGMLFPPTPSLGDAVTNLVSLGVAQALLELVGDHGLPGSAIETELGVFAGTERRKLPDEGAALSLADTIYCRVKNLWSQPLFIHAFSVGLRGSVTMFTSNAKLEQGHELFVGNPIGVPPVGIELGWPDGLPTTIPGVDSLLVIATTAAADLSALETNPIVERGAVAKGSGLEQLLTQVQLGGTRDAKRVAPVDAFLARRLSWVLHPRLAPMSSDDFVIDNSPRGASRSADAWVPEPPRPASRIAIRLAKLVVEDTHAWLPADVRVDALVCTRGEPTDRGYHPTTTTFSRIRDGETLPLDNALLYEGPVRDFVDLYLWVSRDKTRTKSLADLLAERAQSSDLKDALGALLVGAGVVASPWIAAVGASAVLAHTAYEAISLVAGSAIGLYRTSFLARENYGVGRYPNTGLYRAQDFSFSLVIETTGQGQ